METFPVRLRGYLNYTSVAVGWGGRTRLLDNYCLVWPPDVAHEASRYAGSRTECPPAATRHGNDRAKPTAGKHSFWAASCV
jgi:hypothetical protein